MNYNNKKIIIREQNHTCGPEIHLLLEQKHEKAKQVE